MDEKKFANQLSSFFATVKKLVTDYMAYIDTTITKMTKKMDTIESEFDVVRESVVTVDDALSHESTNPLQNKVVTDNLAEMGQHLAMVEKKATTIDSQLSMQSENPVQNQAITTQFMLDANRMAKIEETIGDVETALDNIIAIQNALVPATITFFVDGVEYQAAFGMTWLDVIDSEYNTATVYGPHVAFYESQDGEVYYFGNQASPSQWVMLDGVRVKATDTIVPNQAYTV